jgi:hypothetical protein
VDKELKARLDKIDKIRSDLQKAEKTASKDIMEILKKMMIDNPLIAGIMWQQYTPAFNDGEPCEFSLNGPYIKFDDKVSGAGDKAADDEDSDDDSSEMSRGYIDHYEIDDDFYDKKADIFNFKEIKALKAAVKDVCKVYSHLEAMDRHLQDMFGSGVQVFVTKDGVETEDYDCGY